MLVDVPQKYNWYTVEKHVKILLGRWFAGWETQYSIRQLERLLKNEDFEIVKIYGYGYYPSILRKLRYLYKLREKSWGKLLMPVSVGNIYKSMWEKFEETRWAGTILICLHRRGGKKVDGRK